MSESVFSNRGLYSQNCFPNAIDFIVRSIIKKMINTAIPVMVQEVFAGDSNVAGYVKALPLVMAHDPQNNSIQMAPIPRLPFFRMYAGRCAIVCDPQPGDIGLAVFAQCDSSLVKTDTNAPQPAGSFRNYDMSDGFYLGGFYKGSGDTSIVFDQSGNITINAPEATTVNCKTSTINASDLATINSPTTHCTGNLNVDGLITGTGGMTISGGSGASVQGNVSVTGGDVSADGISLKSHTHTEQGDGNETSTAH